MQIMTSVGVSRRMTLFQSGSWPSSTSTLSSETDGRIAS